MNLDELKFCNCAGCGKLLTGVSCKKQVLSLPPEEVNKLPEFVAGRVLGRPYCPVCLSDPVPRIDADRSKERRRKKDTEHFPE